MAQSYLRDIEEELPDIKIRKIVVFRIMNEEFGVRILDVKEVVESFGITRVPNVKDYLAGIMNMAGFICPLIDLSKIFNYPEHDNKGGKVLVVEMEPNELVGVIVDSVTEVIQIEESTITSPPPMISDKISSKYIDGVSIIGDRIIILVDLLRMVRDLAQGKEIQKIKKSVSQKIRRGEANKPRSVKVKLAQPATGVRAVHGPVPRFVPKNPFWLEGRKVSDLKELKKELHTMSDDVFSKHVTKEKNDFANWIQYGLSDAKSGNNKLDNKLFADILSDMKKADSKEEMIKILENGGV